jgi:hypothetical protein
MKRALVKVLPEYLVERLSLPDDTDIDGVTWDPSDRTIVLSVRHQDLPDVPERYLAPVVKFKSVWRS